MSDARVAPPVGPLPPPPAPAHSVGGGGGVGSGSGSATTATGATTSSSGGTALAVGGFPDGFGSFGVHNGGLAAQLAGTGHAGAPSSSDDGAAAASAPALKPKLESEERDDNSGVSNGAAGPTSPTGAPATSTTAAAEPITAPSTTLGGEAQPLQRSTVADAPPNGAHAHGFDDHAVPADSVPAAQAAATDVTHSSPVDDGGAAAASAASADPPGLVQVSYNTFTATPRGLTRTELQAFREQEMARQVNEYEAKRQAKLAAMARARGEDVSSPVSTPAAVKRTSFASDIGRAFDVIGAKGWRSPTPSPPVPQLPSGVAAAPFVAAPATPQQQHSLAVPGANANTGSPQQPNGSGYGGTRCVTGSPVPSLGPNDIEMAALDDDTTVFFISDDMILPHEADHAKSVAQLTLHDKEQLPHTTGEEPAPVPASEPSPAAGSDGPVPSMDEQPVSSAPTSPSLPSSSSPTKRNRKFVIDGRSPLSSQFDHPAISPAMPGAGEQVAQQDDEPRHDFGVMTVGAGAAAGVAGVAGVASLAGAQSSAQSHSYSPISAETEIDAYSDAAAAGSTLALPDRTARYTVSAFDTTGSNSPANGGSRRSSTVPPSHAVPVLDRSVNGHATDVDRAATSVRAKSELQLASDTKRGADRAASSCSITAIHGGSEGNPTSRSPVQSVFPQELAPPLTAETETGSMGTGSTATPASSMAPRHQPELTLLQLQQQQQPGLSPSESFDSLDPPGSPFSIPSTPMSAVMPGPRDTKMGLEPASSMSSLVAIRHGQEGFRATTEARSPLASQPPVIASGLPDTSAEHDVGAAEVPASHVSGVGFGTAAAGAAVAGGGLAVAAALYDHHDGTQDATDPSSTTASYGHGYLDGRDLAGMSQTPPRSGRATHNQPATSSPLAASPMQAAPATDATPATTAAPAATASPAGLTTHHAPGDDTQAVGHVANRNQPGTSREPCVYPPAQYDSKGVRESHFKPAAVATVAAAGTAAPGVATAAAVSSSTPKSPRSPTNDNSDIFSTPIATTPTPTDETETVETVETLSGPASSDDATHATHATQDSSSGGGGDRPTKPSPKRVPVPSLHEADKAEEVDRLRDSANTTPRPSSLHTNASVSPSSRRTAGVLTDPGPVPVPLGPVRPSLEERFQASAGRPTGLAGAGAAVMATGASVFAGAKLGSKKSIDRLKSTSTSAGKGASKGIDRIGRGSLDAGTRLRASFDQLAGTGSGGENKASDSGTAAAAQGRPRGSIDTGSRVRAALGIGGGGRDNAGNDSAMSRTTPARGGVVEVDADTLARAGENPDGTPRARTQRSGSISFLNDARASVSKHARSGSEMLLSRGKSPTGGIVDEGKGKEKAADESPAAATAGSKSHSRTLSAGAALGGGTGDKNTGPSAAAAGKKSAHDSQFSYHTHSREASTSSSARQRRIGLLSRLKGEMKVLSSKMGGK